MEDHPKVRLKSYKDALFGVYQDWVHQNPGNHIGDGINEDGEWKDRVIKLFCFITQRYNVLSGRFVKKTVSILSVDLDGI